MKFILQCVEKATATKSDGSVIEIGNGILVYVCFNKKDKEDDLNWAIRKTFSICLWEDEKDGRPWRKGITDISGQIIFIYEPRLYASVDNSSEPSYEELMPEGDAIKMYSKLIEKANASHKQDHVITIPFGEKAKLDFVNDGPITITVDSFHRRN
ncbi:D-tyrosyl-tRNA(Tyr) deacylase [Histomonas meleagridis]|uniref:D-tyrosyl-tRNA(Tyr) deacylase n=1 Tax=Histomonas meleagridis TaxID=135588 RepID=UPI00355A2288|nr:D-tyrosyl-tRNA(Tyr) deacylase [Histomonas meleagridis]KAH0802159.1 D-tyrosyl-tRNA(Tyr) deacylase [Histomonas meleagridis]